MHKGLFFWLGLSIILTVILFSLIVPKTVYQELEDESVKACTCYGSEFWFGTKCIGFPVNCSIIKTDVWNKTCNEPSCTDIFDRLYEQNKILSMELKAKAGTDVIVVMDASNSMEGDKLATAKQAAQALVSNLQGDERISIISFSEDASIIHKFSNDKQNLTQSILSITLSGGTNYLPALKKVSELFNDQRRSAKRGIIFLSDGIPSDDKLAILNETKKLEEKGISIFTISFGIKTSDDNNILRQMVSHENDSDILNRRYREFTDTESITEAFYEAWQEISNINIISINPTFEEREMYINELSTKGFFVMLDKLFISENDDKKNLCAPQTRVIAHMINEENVTEQFILHSQNEKYVFKDKDIQPGSYNLTISAYLSANHNGTCTFSGKEVYGKLTILDYEEPCSVASCDETLDILDDFDLASMTSSSLPRKNTYGRVAILMDTSYSMRNELSEVLRGVDRINRLLSSGDKRAFITFSDKSKLVVPLTYSKDEFSRWYNTILPQGTTKIIPALIKTSFLFQGDFFGKDIIVIMTDGIAHDQEGIRGIEKEIKKLIDDGSCVFIIGYGGALLREKEYINLFKDVTKYSLKTSNCGGYAFAPTGEEISSLVTEMFGGERLENESLRLIVDRTKGNDAGSINIDVKVVSMNTGLHLPVRFNNVCIPDPDVSISLFKNNGNEVPLLVKRMPDGSINAVSPYLLPGRYYLQVYASLPVDDCAISQSFEEEFIIIGPPANTSEGVIILAIIIISISIVFLSWEMRKKYLGK